jgi:hypothetical protein
VIAVAAHASQTTATLQRVAVIAIAVLVFLFALLWLFAAIVLVVLALWQGLLTRISSELGIYTPVNALFAAGFVFVVTLLLHFSLVISRLSEQSKLLAQRLALLDERVSDEQPSDEPQPSAVSKR